MLPTLRRQEEGAAEAGSLLSLQAVAAAAPPQPLLVLPGAPAAKPHARGATTFGVNQIKTLPISTQCLLLETATCDVLWVCALGSEEAGSQRPEAWQWHSRPCLPVFWGSQGRVWTG